MKIFKKTKNGYVISLKEYGNIITAKNIKTGEEIVSNWKDYIIAKIVFNNL